MDLFAYMLGKGSGGGGGGGGDYYRMILDAELLNALWTPSGASWQDSGSVSFEAVGSSVTDGFYAMPGDTVTVTAAQSLDMLVVATYADFMQEIYDNPLLYEENISQGDTFTFTMPYEDVMFMTG